MAATGWRSALPGEDVAVDPALARRMAGGDVEALRAVFDALAGRVMAIAVRIVGDRAEAEDLLQDVFLEAWNRSREYDPSRGSVEAWLLTLARSRAIDRRRRGRTRGRAFERARSFDDVRSTAPDEGSSERGRLLAALGQLPAEQQEVIALAYLAGLTQSEISEETGQPLGTVKTRMRLGMARLGELLDAPGKGAQP